MKKLELTPKQKLVLLALRNNELSYGAIIEDIELRSNGKYKFTTELRPLVRYMVTMGLVKVESGMSYNSYRVNMRVKYYKLTKKGAAALQIL